MIMHFKKSSQRPWKSFCNHIMVLCPLSHKNVLQKTSRCRVHWMPHAQRNRRIHWMPHAQRNPRLQYFRLLCSSIVSANHSRCCCLEKASMAGWHQRLDGHEFEWTPGVGDEQGGLVCCSPCGHKESRHNWATELNWTERLSSNSPNLQINLVMIKYNITTFLLCAVSEMVIRITAMLWAGHPSENFTCTDILNSNHSFIMWELSISIL